MTTKEITRKNNSAIIRRIVNKIRIAEPLEIDRAYTLIHDEIFNQPIKNK